MRAPFRYSAIIAVLGFAAALFAAPADKGSDFLITKWTTEQGLPQNTVTSIVQTSDGYIWLGTFGGLARFDGIRFTTFDSTTTPGFKSNRVLSLHENSKGGLWVGTETGNVYLIHNGQFEEFSSGLDFQRKAVWAISEDSLGNAYISTPAGIESYILDDAGWPISGSGKVLCTGEAYGQFKDRNGRIWAKIDQDIVLLGPDGCTSITSFGIDLPMSVYYAAFDNAGRPYIVASSTLGVYEGSRYQEILALDYEIHRAGSATNYIGDRLWYQQAHELYEIHDTDVVVHDLSAYVQSGSRVIFQDNEGNIWLATQADGLVRLARRRVGSAASLLGRDVNAVYSVLEGNDGSIWFSGTRLRRMRDDQITSFDTVSDGSPFPTVKSLAVDRENKIWVGGMTGLYRLEGDQLVPNSDFRNDHILSLFFDRDGGLWIGTEKGPAVLRNGTTSRLTRSDGLPIDAVTYITQMRDGNIWFGTKRGLFQLDAGDLTSLREVKGFADMYVREIFEDDEGIVWIGTYGSGILRLKDGAISAITRANGLPNNFVSRILSSGDGRFWVLNNFGVFVVTRSELMGVADGKAQLLGGAVFGVADGMSSSEANGGQQPAGTMSSDGRMYFPMIDDLIWIDSASTVTGPPKAVIENAIPRKGESASTLVPLQFDTGSRLDLDTDVRNLEINYTGLNFTKPEALRFAFMLEGLDEGWIDAGNRRRAFYGYLPPGDYRFLVKTINADGIWSEPASLRIRVAERFWESRWFAWLLFIALFAVVILFFRRRMVQLAQRQQRQEEFARQLISAGEMERQRIAKELHDGLSQNLLLMKNWSTLAKQKASRGMDESTEYLDKISTVAGESLDETRTIIQNLGPQNLKRFGLTEAIVNVSEQVEDASAIDFEREVENIDGLLDDEAELSVYRMVQEVLNNMVKHSNSRKGRMIVRKNQRDISIAISDFGTGFDPQTVDEGHGLRGLKERADILGGNVMFNSAKGRGTDVTITVPYENGSDQARYS